MKMCNKFEIYYSKCDKDDKFKIIIQSESIRSNEENAGVSLKFIILGATRMANLKSLFKVQLGWHPKTISKRIQEIKKSHKTNDLIHTSTEPCRRIKRKSAFWD